jgi:toxin ParE1/3/4
VSSRVGVDPRASLELEEAAEWYEGQRAGLGRELVLEVRTVVEVLSECPRAGSPVEAADPALDVRRVRVRRFPYQVVYATKGDDVVVIAIAHDRRRSGYWSSRVDQPE